MIEWKIETFIEEKHKMESITADIPVAETKFCRIYFVANEEEQKFINVLNNLEASKEYELADLLLRYLFPVTLLKTFTQNFSLTNPISTPSRYVVDEIKKTEYVNLLDTTVTYNLLHFLAVRYGLERSGFQYKTAQMWIAAHSNCVSILEKLIVRNHASLTGSVFTPLALNYHFDEKLLIKAIKTNNGDPNSFAIHYDLIFQNIKHIPAMLLTSNVLRELGASPYYKCFSFEKIYTTATAIVNSEGLLPEAWAKELMKVAFISHPKAKTDI